jgi:hypothetical protein
MSVRQEREMPTRISVPPPSTREEVRLLAEAVADIHTVLGIVVEHAEELVPGESVDDLRAAWFQSAKSMETLVTALLMSADLGYPNAVADPPVPLNALEKNDLTGEAGRSKRGLLSRLKDAFFRYWSSLPRTSDKQQRAIEAGAEYLEYGATVVSSIPGYDKVEELLLLAKQLLALRARRGD